MGFVMIDAAGLPGWTPHSLTHELATVLMDHLSRYSNFHFQPGLKGLATEEFEGELGEVHRRIGHEIEDIFFKDLRKCSAKLVAALDKVVRPKTGKTPHDEG